MNGSEMRLQNLVPVLDVRDVDESIEFYRSTLGFTVHDKVAWGGRTEWALLRSGDVQLMLCASENDEDQQAAGQADNVFFIYLDHAEAAHVYLSGQRAGVERANGTRAGTGDYYLRDPDGYVLWFCNRPLGQPALTAAGSTAPAVFA